MEIQRLSGKMVRTQSLISRVSSFLLLSFDYLKPWNHTSPLAETYEELSTQIVGIENNHASSSSHSNSSSTPTVPVLHFLNFHTAFGNQEKASSNIRC
jgi:hypothetical protein